MKKVLTKIFGDPQTKTLKRLTARVSSINEKTDKYTNMKDAELFAQADKFRKQIKDGTKVDKLLEDTFALVREVSDRVVGLRHFDVQLIGGMALHEGNVAEMRTGEGKTLVATLPVTLNALTGKGVHVVTVNDYLAQRDAGWMGAIYDAMNLSVAVIIPEKSFIYDKDYINEDHDDERLKHLRPCARKEAYDADITYGTNNEFGFDYLRDNMVRSKEQLRQRELSYAIVDEVDSILIDEARTPLIISAPSVGSGSSYARFAQVARQLKPEHYELDEKRRTVSLNDDGVARVQEILNVENLYAPENVQNIYHLDQALRAEVLFKRDKDYVVSPDNEVIIVDEFTGRLMQGRRYNEGLHQAIEAKEGVEVLQESMTLATISFQNYFRLYDKLSGMTGTAATEADEFYEIYELDVIEVPTNMPARREDKADRIYRTELGKFKSLVDDVKKLNEKGQPVLIGSASIEKNEAISRLLSKAGVDHSVLNAKNNESEASIVARAGQKGAVTLATNIAGRGTDIVLGEGVKELGGLVVIGSERHESRRIDNQLRGRCGRQGDPGMTQFYVSTEDDLMRIFGGDRIKGLMDRLGVDESTPIENKTVSKALEGAQKKVENHNFDSRKNVVQYDDVMNRHRKAIYSTRRKLLVNESIKDQVSVAIEDEAALLATNVDLEPKTLQGEILAIFPMGDKTANKIAKAEPADRLKLLEKETKKLYEGREKDFGSDLLRRIERELYLQILDTNWMQHLESMQHLREGINWRSIGQRDPLVEYRREGQGFFETMQARVNNEFVRALMHIQEKKEDAVPMETELTRAARQSVEAGATAKVVSKPKKVKTTVVRRAEPAQSSNSSNKKQQARKKKKQQRKNRKKRR